MKPWMFKPLLLLVSIGVYLTLEPLVRTVLMLAAGFGGLSYLVDCSKTMSRQNDITTTVSGPRLRKLPWRSWRPWLALLAVGYMAFVFGRKIAHWYGENPVVFILILTAPPGLIVLVWLIRKVDWVYLVSPRHHPTPTMYAETTGIPQNVLEQSSLRASFIDRQTQTAHGASQAEWKHRQEARRLDAEAAAERERRFANKEYEED